ncbi:MAG: family 10 glycosylhydrolase, partial [Gemmatimonadetes bacterium]|nr:family 10 glycosylhydrolase [Gemmatimonadota bacterium]NIQ59040.1 family 10 glycosylhydrolase [Gemmatimonadota bacterium]NIU79248.1 family 10 glycosylhydrolase [Gammaproteobacteria bacterium]NIX47929.1 family 10 glycosylhydrolase [Gemmatimonadota bacterium]NIY12294.1 family 10 glycosylhydrolase [Gemmatimonadota bacterium]
MSAAGRRVRRGGRLPSAGAGPGPSPGRRPGARQRFRVAAALAGVALALAACGESSTVGPDPGPPPIDTVASPDEEARAVWVTRWDWYDRPELEALIDDIARANFNIVYLQVRGRADAYYESGLEPWAHRPPVFQLGRDPGWDPLATALERAHARGLELHVWLNALIGWCTSEPIPEASPPHILVEHPDWVMVSRTGATTADNCAWLTPGQPGVRTRVGAVAADIARRYAVDGVHLDFIRYPNPDFSYDSASEAAFALALETEPALSYDDFRRRLVTATVRETQDSLRAADPTLPLSAAVWG